MHNNVSVKTKLDGISYYIPRTGNDSIQREADILDMISLCLIHQHGDTNPHFSQEQN